MALCHSNFISVLGDEKESERNEFLNWAEGFHDRDGKFIKEFQSTFNSSFWEIYLHAVFKKYGFKIDWSCPSPDFNLVTKNTELIVEATTANSAQGKQNEWDRSIDPEELKKISIADINKEAIIRLSNSILSKFRAYKKKYSKLNHVKDKPFIIAVAPFEQPYFNLQYDRPIKALLYDYYVDEEIFQKSPEKYPNGPPGVPLFSVQKENGAEIPLGLFNDDQMREVSAIIFSCTATWGKLDALVYNPKLENRYITSVWTTEPDGVPKPLMSKNGESPERLTDGLQIYHNPYAKSPIPIETFRRKRVFQCIFDIETDTWVEEESKNCLVYRQVINLKSRK